MFTDWSRSLDAKMGRNFLRNADFRYSGEDWTTEVGPQPAAAAVEWVPADTLLPAEAGKVARVTISGVGSEIWHVQLFQSGVDLRDGDAYVLSFWGRADRERPIGLTTQLDMPDWHLMGLRKDVVLTPEWRKVRVPFTAARTVKEHARVSFLLGESLGVVELADVALQRDPTASKASAPHPIVGVWETRSTAKGKALRFTFNRDGTGSIGQRSGSGAAGAPRAPASNPFRWFLSANNQQLVLASKPYAWSIDRASGAEKLVLKGEDGKVSTLYRGGAGG
jgi:hypothetical protein